MPCGICAKLALLPCIGELPTSVAKGEEEQDQSVKQLSIQANLNAPA
jgi:hypothetical protein